jgi:hypothetical protein
MKTIYSFCLGMLFLGLTASYGQLTPISNTYQLKYDQDFFSVGQSTNSNSLHFAWGVSGHLESMINMYQGTKDLKYMRMFIKMAGNVIDRRDDLRDQIGLDLIEDYRGQSWPFWSNSNYNSGGSTENHGHLVHSGMITFPMLRFAYIVLNEEPELQTQISDNYGRYPNMTFEAIANDIIARTAETVATHDDQFEESGNMGYYRIRIGSPARHAGKIVPFNYLGAFGKTLLYMYKLTGNTEYGNKLERIANYMRANTEHNTSNDSYEWEYWTAWPLAENLSYGGITLSLPILSYEYGVNYNSTDARRYANTFSKGILKEPMFLRATVGATSGGRDFHLNGSMTDYYAQGWFQLAPYDKTIYHALADIYLTSVHAGTTSYPHRIALANMLKYKQNFMPIAANRYNNSSLKWKDAASGDVDGIEGTEVVAIRNNDNKIVVLNTQLTSTGEVNQIIEHNFIGRDVNLKAVTVGNFIGDTKEDIIVIDDNRNNTVNGFYLYEVEGRSLKLRKKLTGWGPASDWAGATSGSFTGSRKDDFIAVRNFNHEVYVYRFQNDNFSFRKKTNLLLPRSSKIVGVESGDLDGDGWDELVILVNSSNNTYCGYYIYDIDYAGNLSLITKSTGWGPASDWNALTVGDYDADGKDEFIVQRNFDNQLKIRKLVGTSIQTLGVDYFTEKQGSDNLLVSGDFSTRSANDELLVFRAFDGDAIMYEYKYQYLNDRLVEKDGFDSRTELSENNMQSSVEELEKVVVYPNPANDQIVVATAFDENTMLTICDLNGKIVLEQQLSQSKSSINIEGLSNGIYFLTIYSNSKRITHKLVKQ